MAKIASSTISVDFTTEMALSYARYSATTIFQRALPNVQDGLKPSQRRILSMMYESGFTSDKRHIKSTRVVGDVMGRLHPHGDSAIYDTMVRLTQPHVVTLPLVDGQGNFGSPQSGPAAPRYTEARLSEAGMLCVEELKYDVVDMISAAFEGEGNKGSGKEYKILPVKFPLLLVNGAKGMAVSIATNIPPHNFNEVMEAALYQLDHQDQWRELSSLRAKGGPEYEEALERFTSSLTALIPAPDFPTGGEIIGAKEGVNSAYKTGRGSIIVRGKYRIAKLKGGKSAITFYELPYGVDPTVVRERITEAERDFIATSRDHKESNGRVKIKGFIIDGMIGMEDYTDRRLGMGLQFTVDAKTNPQSVVADLFDKTPLQSTFSYNMNAIVNGVPKQLSLPEILQSYLNTRREIVKRRATNELSKSNDRLHVISGLIKVVLDVDKAIEIIRQSDNHKAANLGLRKHFKIDEAQAQYVLDTPLKRLTKYDSLDLGQEEEKLKKNNEELQEVVSNKEKQDAMVREEIVSLIAWGKKRGYDVRRSTISDMSVTDAKEQHSDVLNASREVPDEPITLYVSEGKVYRTKRAHTASIDTTTLATVIGISKDGSARRLEVPSLAAGASVPGLVGLLPESGTDVVMATKKGIIFAVEPNWPRHEQFEAMKVADDDEIIFAGTIPQDQQYVFLSSDSSLLTYKTDVVAVKATVGGKGMAGMRLANGEHVVAFNVVDSDGWVVTSTGQSVKATKIAEFPAKGRNTGGVRSHRFLKGEERIVAGAIGANPVFEGGTVDEVQGKRADSGVKKIEVLSIQQG